MVQLLHCQPLLTGHCGGAKWTRLPTNRLRSSLLANQPIVAWCFFLQGIVDPCSGAVRLMFEAAMLAQVGSRDPIALPLLTTLTTEPATAFGVTLEGKRLQNGNVT